MPTWFQNQIKKAFYEKNRYQIKLLNQCWFFYSKKAYLDVVITLDLLIRQKHRPISEQLIGRCMIQSVIYIRHPSVTALLMRLFLYSYQSNPPKQ